jgi:hypothetical protein
MSSCDASGYILLPKGFVRIRHFGFLANRRRATLLPLCFPVLNAAQPSHIRIRGLPCQGTDPALALSQKWLPQGGHRETYACPAPTAFSTLSRRSRRMKLQIHALCWRAVLAPKQGSPLPISAQRLAPTTCNYYPTKPACPLASLHGFYPVPFSSRRHHCICINSSPRAASSLSGQRDEALRHGRIDLRKSGVSRRGLLFADYSPGIVVRWPTQR